MILLGIFLLIVLLSPQVPNTDSAAKFLFLCYLISMIIEVALEIQIWRFIND